MLGLNERYMDHQDTLYIRKDTTVTTLILVLELDTNTMTSLIKVGNYFLLRNLFAFSLKILQFITCTQKSLFCELEFCRNTLLIGLFFKVSRSLVYYIIQYMESFLYDHALCPNISTFIVGWTHKRPHCECTGLCKD